MNKLARELPNENGIIEQITSPEAPWLLGEAICPAKITGINPFRIVFITIQQLIKVAPAGEATAVPSLFGQIKQEHFLRASAHATNHDIRLQLGELHRLLFGVAIAIVASDNANLGVDFPQPKCRLACATGKTTDKRDAGATSFGYCQDMRCQGRCIKTDAVRANP